MAHGAVWGHPPIQRQNTNPKKLTIEKMSKSSLRICTKFGQAHSNDEYRICSNERLLLKERPFSNERPPSDENFFMSAPS